MEERDKGESFFITFQYNNKRMALLLYYTIRLYSMQQATVALLV